MVDFHTFKGPTLEFTGKRKDSLRYMTLPCAVLEFNVKKFKAWYQPLDFAPSIPKMEQDGWVFRIVMLFPHLLQKPEGHTRHEGVKTRPKNDGEQLQFTKYAALVHKLYYKLFEDNDGHLHQALIVDPTIMLLGYRKLSPNESIKDKPLCDMSAGVKVIAAITFRPASFHHPGPAFITWLAVNDTSSTAPKCLGSWRRRGFASFMLVHVIKFCASRSPNTSISDKDVSDSLSLYLQCSIEDSSFEFYLRLGFDHVNKDMDNDGKALLPPLLLDSLANPDDIAFRHFGRIPEEHRVPGISVHPPRLMQLFPGALRIQQSVDLTRVGENEGNIIQQSVQEKTTWCRYPMYLSSLPRTQTILTPDDMNKVVLNNLDLLNNLCPDPGRKIHLLPPSKMKVTGDMMIDTRVKYTKGRGKTDLDTHVLDMMMAILLRDGRYDSTATVLPFRSILGIEFGFLAHQKYKLMQQTLIGKDHMTIEEQDSAVKAATKLSIAECGKQYREHLNQVVKDVVAPNPTMLEKCLLIIPGNPTRNHWNATVIFNPGFIDNQTIGKPRSCFLRYCPLNFTGAQNQPNSSGVLWLLNLARSYWDHCRNRQPPPSMAWVEPYGSTDSQHLLGTAKFPAIRIPPDEPLPEQNDGFNCGIGVIATIGQILRDFGTVERVESLRRRMTVQATTETDGKEYICQLPIGMIGEIPTQADGRDYLVAMREEFFIAFDRLAEFMHMKLPPRLKMKISKKRKAEFEQMKKLVEGWPNPGNCEMRSEVASLPAKNTRKQPGVSLSNKRNSSSIPFRLKDFLGGVANPSPAKRSKLENAKSGTLSSVIVDTAMSVIAQDAAAQTLGSLSEPDSKPPVPAHVPPSAPPPVSPVAPSPVSPSAPPPKPPPVSPVAPPPVPPSALPPVSPVAPPPVPPSAPPPVSSVAPPPVPPSAPSPVSPGAPPPVPPVAPPLVPPPMPPLAPPPKPPPTVSSRDKDVREDIAPLLLDEPAGDTTTPTVNAGDTPPQHKPKKKLRNGRLARKKKAALRIVPGKNVWKYLAEVDRRQQHCKKTGEKPFVLHSPDIEERLPHERIAKGYADSDSESSINTQAEPDEVLSPPPAPLIPNLDLDSIKSVRDKYGYSKEVPKENKKKDLPHLEHIDRQAMAHFVDKSFVDWGWSNHETYLKEICDFNETADQIDDPAKKRLYKLLILAMKRERSTFRRQFEKEFLFTRRGYVKGIRFCPDTQQFRAKMVYKAKSMETQRMEEKVLICNVTERWMRDEFPDDVVQHVVNMTLHEDGFTPVPEGVSFQLLDKKIMRVRYQPAQERYIVDAARVREIGEEALREQRLAGKRDKTDGKRTRAHGRAHGKKEEQHDLPRKVIITEARWTVKFVDDTTLVVGEEIVRDNFGDYFTDELLSMRRGFVDVPVGDNKPSRLHLYPGLTCYGAPHVYYTQSSGRDLCVPKALASVLYQLRFFEEADRIDSFGESNLNGGTVDALLKVEGYARKVLPSWIQIQKLPRAFHWTDMLLNKGTILLGVISASDGSNSHAIAIHNGFIYDANESVALSLSQEALDYCASTDTIQSQFVSFRKGCLFRYNGQKPSRIAHMTR